MQEFTIKERDSYLKSLKILANTVDNEVTVNIDYQYDVFSSLIARLTCGEGLVFNTLFSRISYLGIKYKLKTVLLSDLHLYRKEFDKKKEISEGILFKLGNFLIKELLYSTGLRNFPVWTMSIMRPEFTISKKEIVKRKIVGRYNLLGKKSSDEYLVIEDEDPTIQQVMRVDALDAFKNSIDYIDQKINAGELPLVISLVYIDIDAEGVLLPQIIIIEPDYLVDVTAVAECFKPHGGHARYFLLNKLAFDTYSVHITTGNAVNHFLDEIISDPGKEFEEVITDIFQLDPIRFSLMEDKDIQVLVKTLRNHFDNIKRVVNEDFKSIYLDVEQCVLEPSFYSPVFGLQGRLDVFQQKKQSGEAAIIELKSGKLFMPNTYGLNTNHYTQTLLYELMIRSVYNFKLKPINFILYSALDGQNIRFAPTISAQQKEAVSVRNDIVILEEQILCSNNIEHILKNIHPDSFPGAGGFILRDIEKIASVFKDLSDIEKSYYTHFASFISREQRNSKTGFFREGVTNGQAAFWLLTEKQKSEQFSILQKLKLTGFGGENDSILYFEKTTETNELSNFRKGDIVLLYPDNGKDISQIESQIFKCTITELAPEMVELKLRAKVRKTQFEQTGSLWNLEHDYLDTSFAKMHSGLVKFFSFPENIRNLILTLKSPEKPEISEIRIDSDGLTGKQAEMVKNIVNCRDYFLLWGPPGTGKTSKIIKSVVNELIIRNENILLVAYTNRAVDELCEAVESIRSNGEIQYIRIGSRYACADKYKGKLLDEWVRRLKTRAGLNDLLKKTNIYISTVSSLVGKDELFDIKKFDTIIVDEASQLLEPMIIPVLPRVKRFILVGDHMQLPAVVSQERLTTEVKDQSLIKIGLSDLSNSLFERMFTQSVSHKWDWSYGMLNEQGRMHDKIMKFPNSMFYKNSLISIDHLEHLRAERELKYRTGIQRDLIKNRMIYCPAKIYETGVFAKNNIDEADKVAQLVMEWKDIFELNNMDFTNGAIGIITTFRAQIATIRNKLIRSGIDIQNISIDTVERYQGSARDIVIYSMAVNSIPRFEQIINNDTKGLDRKPNVVITRTKEHFIFLGNEEILNSNKLYRKLIESSFKIEL